MILPVLLCSAVGVYGAVSIARSSLRRGRAARAAGHSTTAARYFCESLLLSTMAALWCGAFALAVLP